MTEVARLDLGQRRDLDVFRTPQRQDTDSWVAVIGDVVRLATEIAGTEFVPKGIRNSVPATAAAMLYGREVGLPPMTALTQIHVIEGRPGMYAEGMRALVVAAGHDLVFDEVTAGRCKMRARRRGATEWTTLEWSLDMARTAGLLGRDGWRKYPRAMLVARCTTDLCRMVFPDVIHGFRSIEEIEDLGPELGPETEAGETRPRATVQRKTRKRAAVEAPVEAPAPRVPSTTPPPAAAPPLPPLPGEDVGQLPADVPVAEATDEPGQSSAGSSVPRPRHVAVREATPEDVPLIGADDLGPRMIHRASVRLMQMHFRRLGLDPDDREERLALIGAIIGHDVATSNDLTHEEGMEVMTTITSVPNLDDLRALLAATDRQRDEIAAQEIATEILDAEVIEDEGES